MSHTWTIVPGLVFLSAVSVANANIIRVPADAVTIQIGINTAVNGDTVLVAPGRYRENVKFRGKNIVLTSMYYQFGDSSIIAATIIDGSAPDDPDTGSVVLIVNHEDSTAILQGFTITDGSGTKWTDEHGSGVYREGGGILTALSSPTIKNNMIINNAVASGSGVVSAGGGGIRSGDGHIHFMNNIVAGNTGRYGAGIVLNFTDALVSNNIITGNIGGQDYGGGAVWVNHPGLSTKSIENNTIAGNVAAGGGISVWFGSPTIVRNNIIWGNTTPEVSVRTGTALTVSYCDIQGGFAGTGNIDRDPGFEDASFHLRDTSACIDGGDPDPAFDDPQDSANSGEGLWPSQGTLRSDMGVYGGPKRRSFPQNFTATSVGTNDRPNHPVMFMLAQNYPNPFNPSTKIQFSIVNRQLTVLKVYDILGREVITLVNEVKVPGRYTVQFDARLPGGQGANLASGVYFYRLQAGSFVETKKLLLLR